MADEEPPPPDQEGTPPAGDPETPQPVEAVQQNADEVIAANQSDNPETVSEDAPMPPEQPAEIVQEEHIPPVVSTQPETTAENMDPGEQPESTRDTTQPTDTSPPIEPAQTVVADEALTTPVPTPDNVAPAPIASPEKEQATPPTDTLPVTGPNISESENLEDIADEETDEKIINDQKSGVEVAATTDSSPSKADLPEVKRAPVKPVKIGAKIPSQNDGGPLSDNSFDVLAQPFSTALASRFDKVPLIWGKEALPVTLDNFQSRLKEKLLQAEIRRTAAESTRETSTVTDEKRDAKIKPERENQYKAVTKMYSDRPSKSVDDLSAMIWGNHEEKIIDLHFAWAQARQSSELSHILERITNTEGVTSFIIFDIYEPEKYPDESSFDDDEIREDENGLPVVKDPKLKMIDGKWETPPHIIYTNTDLQTAKRIIPFTKQLVWRLVETTRDLDPKNDVRYLRLVSDVNEIVVMPMFPRHFLIAIQVPKSEPNKLFENLGLVTTHQKTVDDEKNAEAAKLAILHRTART